MSKTERKILVATENQVDAQAVNQTLCSEFEHVMLSTDPQRQVEDFEREQPDVLVVGFNTIEKAERYYLGLFRLSSLTRQRPHRTVLLCSRDELRRAFELCRDQYFDDYVLFWPIVHDSPRLLMAVYHALHALSLGGVGSPGMAELTAQARQLETLQPHLADYALSGEQRVDAADRSLLEAADGIAASLERFSHQLSDGDLRSLVEVVDRRGLARALEQLKSNDIQRHLGQALAALAPVRQWTRSLESELAPELAAAQAIQTLTTRPRPSVLVIDDDPFQHRLIAHALEDADLDLISASAAKEAFELLRTRRPDLILMDVELPDIDGIQATKRLKRTASFRDIPILMLTGNSEKRVVIESLAAGAVDFIVKPFERETLNSKVMEYLGRGRTGVDGPALDRQSTASAPTVKQ